MSIDAYDTLGISLDATEEDIKKAFKRLSLQHHPDKVQALDAKAKANAEEKFNEIKLAKDILQDAERRKVYDTFGVDLGEERPEMEVWTIGLSTLLSPMGNFCLKTVLTQVVLWFISFVWVGRILFFIGLCVLGLCAVNIPIGGVQWRSEQTISNVVIPVGIVDVLVLFNWVWPLLAETLGVFYLVSEILGVDKIVEGWQIVAIAGVVSLVVARLARGWWFWILALQVILAVVMLAALTVAAGIMRLWIDGVQAQRGEKLKAWRLAMRSERKRLQDEIAELRGKAD